ncbi:hypothetical protein [Streptantibioticus ferralitis]|uniref:Uncharacterized protein n=1 Tax=Streptantibioticus ferralitis TaxID=236510 RepID=A0ABT5Z6J4_9ACTN|nr:hypothetical protein [Streptantibioticus ferralitis]MDF2259451.1 hypothetical protein [Streptantibioticus ferralitis]
MRKASDNTETGLSHGQVAADKLNAALRDAGFTLPTVRGAYPVLGKAMVSMGNAPADLVTRLAEWLQERA